MNRYLPKPKLSISGPGGIQATFDWQAAKNAAAGRMFTVELTNARWVDVLGFGDVRDRGVGAVEQLAVPAVAARDEFDHGVVDERLAALDGRPSLVGRGAELLVSWKSF